MIIKLLFTKKEYKYNTNRRYFFLLQLLWRYFDDKFLATHLPIRQIVNRLIRNYKREEGREGRGRREEGGGKREEERGKKEKGERRRIKEVTNLLIIGKSVISLSDQTYFVWFDLSTRQQFGNDSWLEELLVVFILKQKVNIKETRRKEKKRKNKRDKNEEKEEYVFLSLHTSS